VIGKEFECPKNFIVIRRPRKVSNEEKERMRKMAKERSLKMNFKVKN
jgi:hypothetical protein